MKLSGTTVPCVCFCSVSSPIASAARIPSSMSPCSITGCPSGVLGVRRPHAGVAIGLQFDLDLDRIAFGLARARLQLLRLAERAHQILDMMADLMRDHIGLREIAGRAEALRQLVEEFRVEIDVLVCRAVERPHRRLRGAAARLVASE